MIIGAINFAGRPSKCGRAPGAPQSKGYCFGGGSKEQTVAALRKLIAAIETQDVIIQGVAVETKMSIVDWTETTLSIRYVESDDRPAPHAEDAQELWAAVGVHCDKDLDVNDGLGTPILKFDELKRQIEDVKK